MTLFRQGPRLVRRLQLFLLTALAACSGGSGTSPTPDETPTIVINGLVDGATYSGPVTLAFSTDLGTAHGTIDGSACTVGDQVRTAGAHTLVVSVLLNSVTTTRTVHFTIAAPDGGVLIIRMIDLGDNSSGGGGDAILLTDSSAAGMTHALIDAGPSGAGGNDPAFVSRQLALYHADTLALMVLSHAHDDHYGGMSPVLNAVHVKRFLSNGQVRTLSSYNGILSQARGVADSTIVVSSQLSYTLGGSSSPARLVIVPPLTTWLSPATDDGDQINDGSIGMRLDLGTFSMFFTGDGETNAIANWTAHYRSFVAGLTVLKVGHHGANNAIFDNGLSGTSSWLPLTNPKLAIISANGSTHPRVNAIARILAQVGMQTLCTNVHGTITIRVSRDGSWTVSPAKNAGASCVAGSGANS